MDVLNPLNSFIRQDGIPTFGHLDGIPQSLQLEKFTYFNEMDKPASKWRHYFDFKQFQFVNLVTPDYVIGVAIADIRYLASGFCYLFDIKNNELIEQQWLQPFNIGYETQPSSWSSNAHFASKSIQFSIREGRWHIHVVSKSVNADLHLCPLHESVPLMLCTPTGYAGWTYTQKHNALTVHGNLYIFGKEQELSSVSAGYDFSAGYMRRETSWRWASINCLDSCKRFGLNLASGVNETGYCENVVWVNGERHLLPPVQFHFSRTNESDAWRITSQDLRVDLTFLPLNRRSEKKNFWFLKSNFRQYIGYFSGHVMDDHGIKHKLDGVIGLTEDHYAKW
ncbi:uncharacterized protein DUF2804 [Vibrio sp. ES.051]|uniref:DUF2804 domain-containing protein n=1 Tax=Vibrio sp. ES.051 TaxID=1761909 RepID=UPI000BF99FD5|nr:DUF2804 domain-containing protein [Vibrio sp. ES.051]PFG57994.1 uncharacterized protein DUF2804 [Vibrio sp. ES.051]